MAPNLVKKLQRLRNTSNHTQHRLSAVIMLKGRPLSFGVNDQVKTDPKIKRWSEHKRTHAEMAAIFKIKNKEILKNCSLIVYREDRYGKPAIAKPCPVCWDILKFYGVRSVTYSSASGFVEEEIV